MIAWPLYLAFLGALLLAAIPWKSARVVRGIALACCLAGAAALLAGLAQHVRLGGGLQVAARLPWIPPLGIELHLGADGISLCLLLLTAVASVAGILFSWRLSHRVREFYAFYLLLIGAVYGVFLSLDLFLLFVFYEVAILPKYFLIAIWGSTRREYGAMKLVLYSFAGSALVLAGILAAAISSGTPTFSIPDLVQAGIPETVQSWAFPLAGLGFAVLAGIWPLHTWAPTGHVAAPTAVSMLLAGVVMKLGAYGVLRVAMPLFPSGAEAWQLPMVALAVVGIVWGAAAALTQRDFKFVIGYSSVSHMGFVLLGLAARNEVGISGAVFQMVSHGLLAGLLFAVAGGMVYERTRTRDLHQLSTFQLSGALPFAAVTFLLAGLASVGLPGFSGFVAELQVLIGAWQAAPTAAVLAGTGILLAAAYTLKAMHLAFFVRPPGAPQPAPSLEPITVPERLGTVMLLGCSLLAGLFPQLLLDLILPALQSPWMQAAQKTGGL